MIFMLDVFHSEVFIHKGDRALCDMFSNFETHDIKGKDKNLILIIGQEKNAKKVNYFFELLISS